MTIYDHTWLIAEWERMGRPEVEVYSTHLNKWIDICMENCFWNDRYLYRIKSKPYINWDHVSDEFNWMAEDDDGEARLYYGEPSIDVGSWLYQLFEFKDVGAHKSFTPGACDWKDSLVMRPVIKQ